MAFTTSKLSAPSRSFFIRSVGVLCTILIFVVFQRIYSFHLSQNKNSNSIPISTTCSPYCPNIGTPSAKLLDQGGNTYLTKFAAHEAYESLSSENDVLWEALLPPNGGFIVTYDNDDFKATWPSSEDDDIKHGEHKSHHHGDHGDYENHENTSQTQEQATDKRKQKHSTGISMFHQLHCLGMLRGAIQTLYARIAELEGKKCPEGESHISHHRRKDENENISSHIGHDHEHWTHCFDYLRQVSLCLADATLEPPTSIHENGKASINGMVERQCRDPGILWAMAGAA